MYLLFTHKKDTLTKVYQNFIPLTKKMLALHKFINILIYCLIATGLSVVLYPRYIRLLKYLKAGKTIREVSATGEKSEIFTQLHAHKAGTPTM